MFDALGLSVRRWGAVKGTALALRYGNGMFQSRLPWPRRECPLCGWRGLVFSPFLNLDDGVVRPRAVCPRCGAFERHRAYGLFYKGFFRDAPGGAARRLIHFASEPCLEKVLRTAAGDYQAADFEGRGGARKLDLTKLELADGSVDALVMNHVLSCMRGLDRAVPEMHRVLKPGGVVLAGEAVHEGRATVDYPEARYGGNWTAFGSDDLARRFAPFTVEAADTSAGLDRGLRRRYGIKQKETILILRKVK